MLDLSRLLDSNSRAALGQAITTVQSFVFDAIEGDSIVDNEALPAVGSPHSNGESAVSLPYPHLIAIAPTTVRPLVLEVGEKVRDIVQKKLRMSDVQVFWYHHRWLLPGKAYTQEQIASWRDPLLEERVRQVVEPIMNAGMAGGQYYGGRTVPFWNPGAVFVAAASLPPLSDEGDFRVFTPYKLGLTIVHEMRHLWQAAHGWNMADRKKCERDAEAFAIAWRDRVREVVRHFQGRDCCKPVKILR